MTRSYWLETYSQDDQLEEARFPTRDDAQEVADATIYGGDGYMIPAVVESDDEPNITAADYMAAVWPDYPGRCPEGVDPEEWFAGVADAGGPCRCDDCGCRGQWHFFVTSMDGETLCINCA
jgi:hypothetical protein